MTDEHIDHLVNHSRRPQSGCVECRAAHEQSRHASASRCPESGHIFEGSYERTTGNGAWARGTCPACYRRVGITRPTHATPWPLVGSHH